VTLPVLLAMTSWEAARQPGEEEVHSTAASCIAAVCGVVLYAIVVGIPTQAACKVCFIAVGRRCLLSWSIAAQHASCHVMLRCGRQPLLAVGLNVSKEMLRRGIVVVVAAAAAGQAWHH
jgi:hypothetical protein